jgi:DNA-binding NarL/FixJ family response regulator
MLQHDVGSEMELLERLEVHAPRPQTQSRRTSSFDLTARRDSLRMLALQQQLNGAGDLKELFGRASDLARIECGFDRAVILSVEAGSLRAHHMRALQDPASDRLRRAVLADPVPLSPGTAESEYVRLVEAGRGELWEGQSVLRTMHGLEEFTLGAIMPDDTVIAVLVLERPRPRVEAVDRAVAQSFAQMVTHSVERIVMRQRFAELGHEIRYLVSSATALLNEGMRSPVTLPSSEDVAPVVARIGTVAPQGAAELRELFTRREWSVAREIITGKSNREIAAALQLSPETVKTYVSRVLRKLGATNRADAVARFLTLNAAA